nr:DUF2637 domain-containing protein [Streptomyces acidiscabies]
MPDSHTARPGSVRRTGLAVDAWVRPVCALVVAGVVAYASYVHQREFALQGGADRVSASLWPLSVDGLLLLSTVGLLKPSDAHTRRARGAMWSAFLLGIVVSLAANIAAAPTLTWKPVLVAGWPPVALLLSVELLMHRHPETIEETPGNGSSSGEDDPLLTRARALDARHRQRHQRPVSAETLRKELHVGARRARRLAVFVRRKCVHGVKVRSNPCSLFEVGAWRVLFAPCSGSGVGG